MRVTYTRKLLPGLLVALALVAATACTHNEAPIKPEPGQYMIEVVNPMPHPMNVSYVIGDDATALGTVPANGTQEWSVPKAGTTETIMIKATDEGNTHTVQKEVKLDPNGVSRVTLSQ